jgi:hypothetical protein
MKPMEPPSPIEVGLLIGNGTSRVGFDLSRLDGQGLTVGCNYIYREYDPDFVVAIDDTEENPVVQTIKVYLAKGHDHKWKLIGRNYLDGKFWWLCADQEKIVRFAHINHRLNQNSGILAGYFLASTYQAKRIYMFGIDFFRQIPGEDNDIFFGNCRWKPNIARGWNRLIEDNPQTEFIRVGPIPDRDAEFFTELEGMTFIEYEELPF